MLRKDVRLFIQTVLISKSISFKCLYVRLKERFDALCLNCLNNISVMRVI